MSQEKKRVLIVEDEVKLARFIELELQYEGYEVAIAHDGRKGIELFQYEDFDIVLLDLMLPGLNGLEVVRHIRKSSNTPVIMLTAKSDVMDKVTGLDSGADDYITKPFAIEELLARMRVAFRNSRSENEEDKNTLSVKNLRVNLSRREVKYGDVEIDLTKTEYELLIYLISNKNIVLTREQILNSVWGYDYFGETNVVDVYIRYLRTKIDDKFNEKLIYTTRGVGYYVKDDEEIV